eukprot:760848-Hanusia_phi.AAC.4
MKSNWAYSAPCHDFRHPSPSHSFPSFPFVFDRMLFAELIMQRARVTQSQGEEEGETAREIGTERETARERDRQADTGRHNDSKKHR